MDGKRNDILNEARLVIGLMVFMLSYVCISATDHVALMIGNYQVVYQLNSVACLVFVYALWLLGRVKTRPVLSVLPALALCGAWLYFSLMTEFAGMPLSSIYAVIPYWIFKGGGALALGYTVFCVLHGVYRWAAHKERPAWNARDAAAMAVYVMVIYALTNSARFPRTFEGPVNFALLTVLNSLEYMVFPLLIGALCALPFTHSDKARPATRAIMLTLAAAGTLAFAMPLLPWPSLISFLKGNVVYECMSSLFTPYLMGALIVSAFYIPKKARRFINT